MTVALAIAVFALAASGSYLLMERRSFAVLLGVAVLGHAANLLVLLAGRLRPLPPLITDATTADAALADPLPQAMALTAIVISMAVTFYLAAVIGRTVEQVGEVGVVAAPAEDDARTRDAVAVELRGGPDGGGR